MYCSMSSCCILDSDWITAWAQWLYVEATANEDDESFYHSPHQLSQWFFVCVRDFCRSYFCSSVGSLLKWYCEVIKDIYRSNNYHFLKLYYSILDLKCIFIRFHLYFCFDKRWAGCFRWIFERKIFQHIYEQSYIEFMVVIVTIFWYQNIFLITC